MIDESSTGGLGGVALVVIAVLIAGAKVADRLMRFAERFGWVRTPSAWKMEADALKQRVDELAAELLAVRGELVTVKAENAELRARPDLGMVVTMVERHEARSEEQARAICDALQRIATHVGVAA